MYYLYSQLPVWGHEGEFLAGALASLDLNKFSVYLRKRSQE